MALLRKFFTAARATDSKTLPAPAGPSATVATALSREQIVERCKALGAEGKYAQALTLVNGALLVAPDDAALTFAKASTLFLWGRQREASAGFFRSAALGLSDVGLFLRLAWLSLSAGAPVDAERWARKAVALAPNDWKTHYNLALAQQALRQRKEAVVSYRRALELEPGEFDCTIGLGKCLIELGDATGAESISRDAIALKPDSAVAWTQLGVAIVRQDREEEALIAFERAVVLDEKNEEDIDGYINLAINLRDAGRLDESLALFERNLPTRPAVHGHLSYAHALLKAGRFAEGWEQYEFRWLQDPLLSLRAKFLRPVWSGQDLNGKTILLRSEQGAGDMIQFVRYAPMLKALGATVLLTVLPGMDKLATGFAGIDQVLDRAKPPPNFDFYIHPMSLPLVFGTELAAIPLGIPYLRVPDEYLERWRGKFDDVPGLRVGLVWGGSPSHERDKYRSIPLAAFAPLSRVNSVSLFSLQKGPPAAQIAGPPSGMNIVDLASELNDFCDTAAAISYLDLVICVDTSVAHLAGALGKEAWVLLPDPPDFRWMDKREDSPWYPSLRLFRQRERGKWDGVIEHVAMALQERAPGGSSPSQRPEDRAASPEGERPSTGLPVARATSDRFSAAVETRVGILQYFRREPVEGESTVVYGEYLQGQMDLLLPLVRSGATVLEVQPGVGIHSIAIAEKIGEQGHLVLYESRSLTARVLRQNIEAHHLANVTLMQGRLVSSGDVSQHQDADAPASAIGAAENQTLDALQLEHLDWLKINLTASAADVVAGGGDTLWRLRPLLHISVQDAAAARAVADRVTEFGYRCWSHETRLFNPENFNRREADIFAGQFVVAVIAVPEEATFDLSTSGCREIT